MVLATVSLTTMTMEPAGTAPSVPVIWTMPLVSGAEISTRPVIGAGSSTGGAETPPQDESAAADE